MRIQSPNGIDLRSVGMLVGEANKFQSHIMMYHGEYKNELQKPDEYASISGRTGGRCGNRVRRRR